ncbi:MAG TPA: flagellar hook-basal body protein [Solirubrobacteraceae bacterium]|nr:flagellar hook-basal body protein [Solirubrobacteraceae bacterium]
MLDGLYSAASGMAAQQRELDAISDDLANESTPGYKSQRVAFGDLLYSELDDAGTTTTTGAGAEARTIGRDGAQGAFIATGKPLDLAIAGAGYFQVKLPNGQTGLTRNGSFGVDAQGTIVDAAGNPLQPPISLPRGVSPEEMAIAPDGTVTAGKRTLGKIELAEVPSPDHLLAAGDGVFEANASSGAIQPAAEALIAQGTLEGSNVDVAEAMANLVTTQRGYQLDSSAIQTESQMASIANQLRP